MSRVSTLKIIVLNLCWVGISFLWNGLHVIVLPAVLLHYVDLSRKNTILGLMTGAGLVIAMIVQPIAGALSDQWRSKWGRRRPMMLIGLFFDLIFLTVLAVAGGIPGLAIGYTCLQFSSNLAHGAMQGLMPDVLPKDQLGRGSAFKTVLDMIGLVVVSLWLGNVLSPDSADITDPMIIIAGVLIISFLSTITGIRERSTIDSEKRSDFSSVFAVFKIDFRQNRSFVWLIVSRLVFLLGVYGVQAFAQYFIRDTLPGSNPVQLTGNLMAMIVVGLVASSLAAGFLSERIGNKIIHVISAVLVCVGSLLMATARTPSTVLIYGLIIGAGIGIFLTSNWAVANSLAPSGEAGKFLGLTNLATAGASATSRLFGPIIDSLNGITPLLGYTALFITSAVCALIGLILFFKVFPAKPAMNKETVDLA